MTDFKKRFDFDTPIERRQTASVKWDLAAPGEIPMWVADMDFQAAPAVLEALEERLHHGVFGYSIAEDKWYNAYISWWERRHAFSIRREWMVFAAGIVPAISSIVRELTSAGENIVLQAPVYHVFYNCIRQNGRNCVENELIYDREKGTYCIDFEDLEAKLAAPETTMMILCNPHNPISRLWSKEELTKIGELCLKHHVIVVSDEIHCDLVRPGCSYTPFASISEECCLRSITCVAPTKAFNLAGLKTAAVIISNPEWREKINAAFHREGTGEMETFAVPAAVAAYNDSEDWLDQLNEYLFENRRVFEEYVRMYIPGAFAVPGDATYLLWLDISEIIRKEIPGRTSQDVSRILRDKAGVFVSAGSAFGTGGDGFLRVNIACPRSTLMEGLERLQKGLASLKEA